MGRLRAQDPEREIELPTRCLVGRAPACDLVLDGKTVSGHHAVVEWNGTAWEVQDLGSRNGTYFGDERLRARSLIAPGTTFIVGRTSLEFTPR